MCLQLARPLYPLVVQQAIPDRDMLHMETLKAQVTALRMTSGTLMDETLNSLPQTGELLPPTGVHLEEEEEAGEMEEDITQMKSTRALPIALMMATLVGIVKG